MQKRENLEDSLIQKSRNGHIYFFVAASEIGKGTSTSLLSLKWNVQLNGDTYGSWKYFMQPYMME